MKTTPDPEQISLADLRFRTCANGFVMLSSARLLALVDAVEAARVALAKGKRVYDELQAEEGNLRTPGHECWAEFEALASELSRFDFGDDQRWWWEP